MDEGIIGQKCSHMNLLRFNTFEKLKSLSQSCDDSPQKETNDSKYSIHLLFQKFFIIRIKYDY